MDDRGVRSKEGPGKAGEHQLLNVMKKYFLLLENFEKSSIFTQDFPCVTLTKRYGPIWNSVGGV